MSALAERPADAVVGLPAVHESARLHVTGAAIYTDDLAAQTAGTLTAWPVQSTNAHARVWIDTAPAYDVPVVGGEHALAWVLGETQEAARLGAEAVLVEYEPLPSLVTVPEAIAAESFQGVVRTLARGDTASALAASDRVFEGVTELGGQEHFYLETHASFAIRDSEGQYLVQCSTQHPSETQAIVAHVLGIPSSEVTVQSLRMGGAFGGKEMQPHGFAPRAAMAARSATSTTPTGSRTCTPSCASPRRTRPRRPRSADSAARRACS